MRFRNDGNKVVDDRDVLNIKCVNEVEAKKVVEFLNDQQDTIRNARGMTVRLRDKLDKGYEYSLLFDAPCLLAKSHIRVCHRGICTHEANLPLVLPLSFLTPFLCLIWFPYLWLCSFSRLIDDIPSSYNLFKVTHHSPSLSP